MAFIDASVWRTAQRQRRPCLRGVRPALGPAVALALARAYGAIDEDGAGGQDGQRVEEDRTLVANGLGERPDDRQEGEVRVRPDRVYLVVDLQWPGHARARPRTVTLRARAVSQACRHWQARTSASVNPLTSMRYCVRNGSDGTKWLMKPKAAKTAATRTARGDQTAAMAAALARRREQRRVVAGPTRPRPSAEPVQGSLLPRPRPAQRRPRVRLPAVGRRRRRRRRRRRPRGPRSNLITSSMERMWATGAPWTATREGRVGPASETPKKDVRSATAGGDRGHRHMA